MKTENAVTVEDDDVVTVKEAAPLLKVAPSTLYEKAAAGIVPHIVLWEGRRKPCIRFSRKALRDFVRERTKGAAHGR